MTKQQLAKAIFNISHLTGEFKLRSGLISKEYFDKYRFEARPELLKAIAQHMKPLIPEGTEVLAGLEMGGIPITTALSFETNLPCAFIRKEAKTYGTCQFSEGAAIKGKKLCLIEDVITTGGQVVKSTQDLRQEGAFVSEVLCVIYRTQGPSENLIQAQLNYQSLFTMDELKKGYGI